MTDLLLALGVAVGVVHVATVALARRRSSAGRDGWLARVERREIIVHTSDGQSFRGLLDAEEIDGLALRAVKLLGDSGDVPLGGEVFIPRARIEFVQSVPVE